MRLRIPMRGYEKLRVPMRGYEFDAYTLNMLRIPMRGYEMRWDEMRWEVMRIYNIWFWNSDQRLRIPLRGYEISGSLQLQRAFKLRIPHEGLWDERLWDGLFYLYLDKKSYASPWGVMRFFSASFLPKIFCNIAPTSNWGVPNAQKRYFSWNS